MSAHRDSDLLNHLDRSSTTYKPNRPLVRGAEVETPDICHQCPGETPLSECTIQAHWEKRLKAYHLNESRAFRPLMESPEGEQVDRLVPLSIQDADRRVVGPLVLPDEPELQEVFVMESLGKSYPHEPRRFWPNPTPPLGSTYIKSYRMGLEYGQEMPHD